jgi:hypothetical protein
LLLVVVSFPGAIYSLILANPPRDGDAPLAALPPLITQTLSASLASSYLAAAVLGTLLLVAAAIGKIITNVTHQSPASRK